MQHFTLIAEIGCNHMGDMHTAKKFIDSAHDFCGVSNVKFQKRNNKELIPHNQYAAPHPVPENSYGETYGKHREYLEFDLAQHRELKAYCESKNMVYSTSVWDITSLDEIISLEPEYIKIPSATNTNLELLERACKNYGGQIHISLGMTTKEEEENIIKIFRDMNRLNDLILYACTSGYPIKAKEAFLLEISRLADTYGDQISNIGYSGHHNGIDLDIAALTLGAHYIERHFTLDRTWKGTDHAASLEPDGLRRLNRNLQHTSAALQSRPSEIVDIELPQRAKLKWKGAQ